MPLTLITMGQGNIKSLERTIESMEVICNEVVFGDMLIFEDDRTELYELKRRVEAKGKMIMNIIRMDFNFIFKFGFASTLNRLAAFALNDMVIYMNVSEVIDKNLNASLLNNPEYNTFFFNHSVDTHHWIRCYNRKQLYWSGVLHEVVIPYNGFEYRTCIEPIFMMADTEKDMDNPFKAKVFNDVKELVYFNQYVKLVEQMELCGATNSGWVQFAQRDYDSFRHRLNGKKNRLWAFQNGQLVMYLDDINTNSEFATERQESSQMVNLQGIRHDIL